MILIACALSYLIGSIPTAYIFGRMLKGIDIREHGSGNVGATNVFRVLGKGPGIAVLLLDIIKGIIPLVFVPNIFGMDVGMGESALPLILIAVAAVAGHNWTIFLKFKGGKGIATTLGVLIGLSMLLPSLRLVLSVVLLAWLFVFLTTRFVSLSSMVAAIVLPLVMVFTNQPFELICLGAVFCVFVVLRHKANIQRLLHGREPRVPLPWKK